MRRSSTMSKEFEFVKKVMECPYLSYQWNQNHVFSTYKDDVDLFEQCSIEEQFIEVDNDEYMEPTTDHLEECTLVEQETLYGGSSLSMNVFPQFILKMGPDKVFKEYVYYFHLIQDKFLNQSGLRLYINWKKLSESYVWFVFQRLKLIYKDNKSLEYLEKYFWEDQFLFQQSSDSSINMFQKSLASMGKRHLLKVSQNVIEKPQKLVFGIWLDSQNHVLLFANTAVNFSLKESLVKSVHGNTMSSRSDVVKKLLLFLNLAIVESLSRAKNFV
ncbi:hypothetical protein NCAS_0G01620 [Naumovozyma castellii]|uniref:Uncharacterized protein n=1 Tax=Naumovozyma castellii TaxID=27288 RepID=G0VI15_NAUCA|nr:hypothetical protein NCAS_0G01620 [Naumovozyma castellii CBS 4309]CCC71049.1 hypothetical protein NCAS_0G01620 [Naumovozyma castellii CBS 4309]